MAKPIVAVDIDDVLSQSAEAFAMYSNERWQSGITAGDYQEDWGKAWRISREEAVERAIEYQASGIFGKFSYFEEALPILKLLANRYEFVIVTSRREMMRMQTDEWIERHFTGVFSTIRYCGFYDRNDITVDERLNATKAKICKDIGAAYLIDDQLKHCIGAAEAGVEALLFGNYSWNQHADLPAGVTRVQSWPEVASYLGGAHDA